MMRDEAIALLRQQRARGPLPSSREGLASFLAGLQRALPAVRVEVPPAAVSPLRAAGIEVEEREARFFARFPADGDAFDRVLSLAGAPLPAGGGAAALLSALEQPEQDEAPPPISLPLRIQPSKASALGWAPELFSLTVLIGNAAVRDDGALLPRSGGPSVGVCAEYDRPLTSLDPPGVAGWALQGARARGVPTLRLHAGWLRTPIRVEPTSRLMRASSGRKEARARAGQFLEELETAWKRRIGPPLEVAWPVYRSGHGGPLLDAVVGRPLPEMNLG